jgi:hypothetical protein
MYLVQFGMMLIIVRQELFQIFVLIANPGTNADNRLYAILVDPVTNNALASTTVNANGTYFLSGCPIDAVGMKVVISTSSGVIGSPVPAESIPADWVNTSPLTHSFNSGVTDVTGIDFGIEKIPDSDPKFYTIAIPVLNSFLTLNGASTVDSPGPLSGSDFEDGVMGPGKTVKITTVPTNSQLYYNGVLVTNGTTIVNYNPALLRIKFTDISILSTVFYYAYIDAASKQDPSPAAYIINFSSVLDASITAFTVKKSLNSSIVLNWSAFTKAGNSHFIVERSVDGVKFASIGTVVVEGSGAAESFVYTDNNIPETVSCFYRVVLVNNGNTAEYSRTLKLSLQLKPGLEIYPNPFQDRLTVKLSLANAENVTIVLTDNTGRIIQKKIYPGKKGRIFLNWITFQHCRSQFISCK